jgi:protein SCO1
LTRRALNVLRSVAVVAFTLITGGLSAIGNCQQDDKQNSLSKIGPAPDFTLTNQDGKPLSLSALRGKVTAVTFIFTGCGSTCPLLTAKLVSIQKGLGADFGRTVFFAAITVDPLADTPSVLKRYARAYGADLNGWAFLTGTPAQISEVTHRYAVYYKEKFDGDIDHTFLTSLIDAAGTIRVQYLGVRFDSNEFLQDIQSLLREKR